MEWTTRYSDIGVESRANCVVGPKSFDLGRILTNLHKRVEYSRSSGQVVWVRSLALNPLLRTLFEPYRSTPLYESHDMADSKSLGEALLPHVADSGDYHVRPVQVDVVAAFGNYAAAVRGTVRQAVLERVPNCQGQPARGGL